MPRQSRIDAPGALHHVMIRGIERREIFRDDKDRENFIERLGGLVTETQTQCFAWALIPNHFHLLLKTGHVPISSVMGRLLTGYAIREFRALAEGLDGESIIELTRLACELNICLGFGMVLRIDGDLFNGYIITGKQGVTPFGKFHRWWLGDRDFTRWPHPAVLELPDFTLGVMVCFDGRFPEVARVLTLAGADVIIWPSCWPNPPRSNPEYLNIIGRARSFENQVYIALANRCGESEYEGTSYAGMSSLFDPLGGIVAQADSEEEIVSAVIDTEILNSVRGSFDIYSERRPPMYLPVAQQRYPKRLGGR